jgi:hypothetical protein
MNPHSLIAATFAAFALSVLPIPGAGSAAAQDSGFGFRPNDDPTEDWAFLGEVEGSAIGIDWFSFDSFGDNIRDIRVIIVEPVSSDDGTDYYILRMLLACNQPRGRIVSVSAFRLDGSPSQPTEQSPEQPPEQWDTMLDNSPFMPMRNLVCSADRPDGGQFDDAQSFATHIRDPARRQ